MHPHPRGRTRLTEGRAEGAAHPWVRQPLARSCRPCDRARGWRYHRRPAGLDDQVEGLVQARVCAAPSSRWLRNGVRIACRPAAAQWPAVHAPILLRQTTASTTLAAFAILEEQAHPYQQRLVGNNVLHAQRVTAIGARHIRRLLLQLHEDRPVKAALAKRVAAGCAHRLPEGVPADWASEVAEDGVIDVLEELPQEVLPRFEAAYAEGGQLAGSAKLRTVHTGDGPT